MNIQRAIGIMFLATFQLSTKSQTIDFESVPGGTPVDKLMISTQYLSLYGVSFRYEDGRYPYLAEEGLPRTSFIGPSGGDSFAANQGIGRFFLTDNNINITNANQNVRPPPLIIEYVTPVTNASGVIIDLDDDFTPPNTGTEAWLFQAFNQSSNPVASVLLNTSNSFAGDGRATPWNFKSIASGIKYIRVTFEGTKTNGIGFAFDNFSPALVVTPPQLSITITQGVRISISGTIGSTNSIEYHSQLGTTNWQILTNLTLTRTPQLFVDSTASNSPTRFYRVISTR